MSNTLLESLLKKIKLKLFHVSGCVYLRGSFVGEEFKRQKQFVVDLNSRKYIHLGDVLFFIPLIIYLSKLKPVVVISPEYKFNILKCFLPEIENITSVRNYDFIAPNDCVVTQPYAIDEVPLGRVVVALGNAVDLPNIPYPLYLLKEFCEFAGLEYTITSNFCIEHFKVNFNRSSGSEGKRLFISPFISSGKFRDLFGVKQKTIIEYAAKKRRDEGFEIFLFGSCDDELFIDFPFIDLRGAPVEVLIDLVRSRYFSMGVGFDNFWMHVSDIFDVEYLVLFRGRMSKFGRSLHFSSVNVSFYKSMKRLYLNLNGKQVLK